MSTEPNPAPTPEPAPEPTPGTTPPPPPAPEPVDPQPVVEVVEEVEVVEVGRARPQDRYGLLVRIGTELAGTFVLVLVLVSAQVFTPVTGISTLGIALAGGLTFAGLYAAFAHVSGAHFNPALSIASAIAGRVRTADAALYVIAQVLAAVLAAAVAWIMVPAGLAEGVGAADRADLVSSAANGFAEGSPLSNLTSGQLEFGLVAALVVEVLGTAVLAGVLLATRPSARSAVPLGLTYAAMLLLALPVDAGGLNPARSTGVAVFMAGSDHPALGQLWLFWVAPLVGAGIAGLAKLALGRREQVDWLEAEADRA